MSKEREWVVENVALYLVNPAANGKPIDFDCDEWNYALNAAKKIDAIYESLGYIQPEPSVELEQAIKEFVIAFVNPPNEEEEQEAIEAMKVLLSANHLVQLDEDQSLPEIRHRILDWSEDFEGYEYRVAKQAQQDMKAARFKKVKE